MNEKQAERNRELLARYRRAYEAANAKPLVRLEWIGGWFEITTDTGGPKKYRRAEILQMCETLEARIVTQGDWQGGKAI